MNDTTTNIYMGEYQKGPQKKKRKKTEKWKIVLLVLLILLNLSIPAYHLRERLDYTSWPDDLDIVKLEADIMAPLKMKAMQNRQFDETEEAEEDKTINEKKADETKTAKQEFLEKLMHNKNLNIEDDGSYRGDLVYARRQMGMLRYNIENSVFLKKDMEKFRTIYNQSLADGTVKEKEAKELLQIIALLNYNTIEKIGIPFREK